MGAVVPEVGGAGGGDVNEEFAVGFEDGGELFEGFHGFDEVFEEVFGDDHVEGFSEAQKLDIHAGGVVKSAFEGLAPQVNRDYGGGELAFEGFT